MIVVLATVLVGFVVTSFVTQHTSATIESLSDAIVTISAPSIDRLAELRGRVFEVELMTSERVHGGPTAPDPAEVDAALDELHEAVRGYLELRQLPGEQPLWGDIQRASIHFGDSVRQTIALADAGKRSAAERAFSQRVEPAGRQLIGASLKGVEFHADQSRELATKIREARHRAVRMMNLLSLVSIALGVGGGVLLVRQLRRHRAMVDAYTKFHAERADELEQFAGRVAHDIRNPLAAAKLASEFALRKRSPSEVEPLLRRVLQSLARADSITTALLDFARSGARPDPGARTDPAEVLADLESGLRPEAERLDIELEIPAVPPVLVGCSTGVYLSLVGNLVRNAMKYMGDSPVRRIAVRVTEDGAWVRTEVADTGPGIAATSLQSLFEPYFRVASDRAAEGLGLGLATVKKLAEGHGGQVGVTSVPGRGSTFWFVLPRAGSRWGVDAPVETLASDEPHVHH